VYIARDLLFLAAGGVKKEMADIAILLKEKASEKVCEYQF
jgi:hypothetical protein